MNVGKLWKVQQKSLKVMKIMKTQIKFHSTWPKKKLNEVFIKLESMTSRFFTGKFSLLIRRVGREWKFEVPMGVDQDWIWWISRHFRWESRDFPQNLKYLSLVSSSFTTIPAKIPLNHRKSSRKSLNHLLQQFPDFPIELPQMSQKSSQFNFLSLLSRFSPAFHTFSRSNRIFISNFLLSLLSVAGNFRRSFADRGLKKRSSWKSQIFIDQMKVRSIPTHN
jgi:hypothetical protein